MPKLPPSIGPLLIGAAFLQFAGGMNGLILPLRGAQEGFSAFSLGLLGTGWALGFIAGCLIIPGTVKRVGHIRTFGAMTALAAISILLSLLIINEYAWIPLRAIAGFCFAGAAQIMESWINERAPAQARGRIFGLYAMVNLLAITGGQMVIPLGNVGAETFFVLGAIFYALAMIPTALYASQAPQPLTEAKLDLKLLWQQSPIAVVGVALVGVANSAFGTLAAVYGNAIGMGVTAIAIFLSVTLLAGALAQVPVGYLSDRTDRRYVLIAVAVLALASSVFFIAYSPRDTTVIFVAAIAFGAFIHTMYPLLVSHANDHAEDGNFMQITGGLLLVFGFGSVAGPLLAGIVMSAVGPEGLFITVAACHAIMIAFTIWRIMKRAPVPIEARDEFVIMPSARYSTPESLAFDPRSIGTQVNSD